jgi:uncharacterized protein (DUF2235 family)
MGRAARWVYNKISQATSLGTTANIIDCDAAAIRLWQPGDKIYLFGLSRGAYTVRCVAAVIGMCGIPQRDGTSKVRLAMLLGRPVPGWNYTISPSRRMLWVRIVKRDLEGRWGSRSMGRHELDE